MKRFVPVFAACLLCAVPLRAQLVPITAKELLPEVTASAQSDLGSDAQLVDVFFASATFMGYQISMDLSNGKATGWLYRFHSAALDSSMIYVGVNLLGLHQVLTVPDAGQLAPLPVQGDLALEEPFIDSPQSLQAVKDAGAQTFLNDHPDAWVQAAIAAINPVELPIIPAGKVWFFDFAATGAAYACAVDAQTGAGLRCGIISGLRTPSASAAVPELSVHPNPVPFGTEAVVVAELRLAHRSPVDVSLMDVLGRVRARWSEGVLEAGIHTISSGGFSRLPVGVSFLRVDTDAGSAMRTVVVVR